MRRQIAGDGCWNETPAAAASAPRSSGVYEGGPTRRWLNVKQQGWTVEEDRWRRRISVAPALGP
jgi:hypothetical protein